MRLARKHIGLARRAAGIGSHPGNVKAAPGGIGRGEVFHVAGGRNGIDEAGTSPKQ